MGWGLGDFADLCLSGGWLPNKMLPLPLAQVVRWGLATFQTPRFRFLDANRIMLFSTNSTLVENARRRAEVQNYHLKSFFAMWVRSKVLHLSNPLCWADTLGGIG